MSDLDNLTRDLNQQRKSLSASIDALAEAVSPQQLHKDATRLAGRYRDDLAQQVLGKVRDNPMGGLFVALGVGLIAKKPARKHPTPLTNADHHVRTCGKTAAKDSGFVGKNPLAAGAAALGIGVLAGALLPRNGSEKAEIGKAAHRERTRDIRKT